eukprot:Phypoly_transcript_05720.p1 GENE.Phypoly_transcript_05720~~Phypoly_transcript_05720.p1  ORF type:complete len:500 (+),score=53.32 Phypoly_transcript_05720:92-1501(+)
MESVITAVQSKAPWIGPLEQFNSENASAFTFADRFGADTKVKFVEALASLLQECRSSGKPAKDQERELGAILTAIRICFREPVGINQIFESTEKLEMVLDYACLLSQPSNATTSWVIQSEASKCLVNLVAKNKQIETALVDQFKGTTKIIELLQNQELPLANLFPLLRILLHLSLTPEVAQATRTPGMNAVIHILKQCFPSINQLNPTDTTPLATFNESDPVPTEALKVAFNLTLALGPLANGKPLTPEASDITTFHQLQPLFFHILTTPLPPQRTSFQPIHTYIHQLKLCVVNCLLNTPKGQFQESFGAPTSENAPEPDSYMQPLNSVASARSLRALLDILAIQTQMSTNETPSEALAPILMLLTTLAQEVPTVRETMKLYLFPREVLEQVPQKVAVEIPTLVAEQLHVASKLIPFMSSLEPALKHYVNEFFYFICDEDANEVCRLTGFGNAAGLLVMRGLMNVPGSS